MVRRNEITRDEAISLGKKFEWKTQQ
jgi:hypothetical protein